MLNLILIRWRMEMMLVGKAEILEKGVSLILDDGGVLTLTGLFKA